MVSGRKLDTFRVILGCFCAGLLAGSVFFSKCLGRHYPSQDIESLMYIPSGEFLRVSALGHPALVADLLWIRTINYFGLHALGDRNYAFLPSLIKAINVLDPDWEFPFHFAGIILGTEAGMVREANKILVDASEKFPDEWEFPFYLGFNYFHTLQNSHCGAKYIFRASSLPGSPAYLKPLAAKLSKEGNSIGNHLAMCNRLLSMTEDKGLRDQIIKNCKEALARREAVLNAEEVNEECR